MTIYPQLLYKTENQIHHQKNDQNKIRMIIVHFIYYFLDNDSQRLQDYPSWSQILINFIIITMGCSSQMGCLGPKPRERQVYLDLIQSIYNEVQKITIPDKNEEEYTYVKNILAKKGLLRKLTDNLKSHQMNVSQCLAQNSQKLYKAQSSITRITSLIIVDKIMEDLASNRSEISLNNHSGIMSNISTEAIKSQNITVAIDLKIEGIYFKQVIYLLQKENKSQQKIFSSLGKFCELREDKFLNKSQIYCILSQLHERIAKNQDKNHYLHYFELLIGRLKQNLKEPQKDQQFMKTILHYLSNQKTSTKQNQLICQNILKIYMNKYFGDYSIIQRSIVQILDFYYFQKEHVDHIQKTIKIISKQEDGYNTFRRGLFIFIMRYLLVQQKTQLKIGPNYRLQQFSQSFKNVLKQQTKCNAFSVVTQWINNNFINIEENIAYSSPLIILTYANNYFHSSSDKLKSHFKKRFQIIVLFLSFAANVHFINILVEEIQEKETADKKRIILLGILKQIINVKKMLVTPKIFESCNIFIILQPYYSFQFQLQLIQFFRYIIKYIKYQDTINELFDLSPLMCQFLHSLYLSLISNTIRNQQIQLFIKDTLKNQINDSNLTQNQLLIFRRVKFTTQISNILKILLEQHYYNISLSFLELINENMVTDDEQIALKQAYILLFFIQFIKRHTFFLVNKKQKYAEDMFKIILKLQQNVVNKDIQRLLSELLFKIITQCEKSSFEVQFKKISEKERYKKSIQTLKIDFSKLMITAKSYYMIKEGQYDQMKQNFKDYFKSQSMPLQKREHKEEFEERSGPINFRRHPSINLTQQEYQTQGDGQKQEAEQSFRQIVSKIQSR